MLCCSRIAPHASAMLSAPPIVLHQGPVRQPSSEVWVFSRQRHLTETHKIWPVSKGSVATISVAAKCLWEAIAVLQFWGRFSLEIFSFARIPTQGRKEKRVSRRGLVGDQRFPTRREGGPAGGRARKSELAWWHSYFAAGGTLIALACFAAMAFLFVNESPPTLPGWFGRAERKADNHDGDNRPESHSDSLAESRSIVRFETATNVSTTHRRRRATKRRIYGRYAARFFVNSVRTFRCEAL